MGGGSWDSGTWARYRSEHVSGKTMDDIFVNRSLQDQYDPKKISMRESCDSADNPRSTPIILGVDVTGSMGMVANALMGKGLDTLCTEIYDRRCVSDPHVMTAAIGDLYCDRAPLQVTQFEADIRIAEQTKALWLEKGGGGNDGESYSLLHIFAAMKTSHDSFEKRGKKGYLVTVGDEPVLWNVDKSLLLSKLGIESENDLTAADCVRLASRTYECFHVVLSKEGHARHDLAGVKKSWERVLPERVVELSDYTKLSETVISLIQVYEGMSVTDVAGSWSGDTSIVVANAVGGLKARSSKRGLVRF